MSGPHSRCRPSGFERIGRVAVRVKVQGGAIAGSGVGLATGVFAATGTGVGVGVGVAIASASSVRAGAAVGEGVAVGEVVAIAGDATGDGVEVGVAVGVAVAAGRPPPGVFGGLCGVEGVIVGVLPSGDEIWVGIGVAIPVDNVMLRSRVVVLNRPRASRDRSAT
jgi:hypothetical protein